MFAASTIILIVLLYVGGLFLIALWTEARIARGLNPAGNRWVYSLSLAVYLSSWTYYGSVGMAARSGLTFLALFIGTTLGAPFWWVILRKLVRIKNAHRITSIADFISARYDKSQGLAMLVTPFVNNATTAVILAPIAVELAQSAAVPPALVLMAVAIGASSDFLTPFGHHNNTLAYGLGGYSFAVLSLNLGETTFSLLAAILLSMLFAAVLGYFMIYGRISDIYEGTGQIQRLIIAREILGYSSEELT